MKFFITLIVCTFTIPCFFAQGPANNWYFGQNAGITFTTSPPSVLTDGNINTFEGCASISDERGDLLFYTDGRTIYNKEHTIMQNGSDLFGDASSTQSAIIIPKPLDDKIYYVFTVDVKLFSDPMPNQGVNYSIVDFTNNPNGEVTLKNNNLLSYSSEKLSAVLKGCTSDSVWVVTLSTENGSNIENGFTNLNTFYAYEITPAGVNEAPVTSTFNMNIEDARGNLKFSPDGKKIACANATSGLYLLDFDSQTGQISNPEFIDLDSQNFAPYGVEFSPNNNLLYIHTSNSLPPSQPPSEHSSSLFQLDLTAPDIAASQVLIDEQSIYRGSLQLGPDGKIYRNLSANYDSGLPYLSVIENPNQVGVNCNYNDRAIFLGSAVSFQGLPPFNQSLFNTVDIIQNDISTSTLNLCEDESYTLQYEDIPGATYTWYRNENIISGETSAQLDISLPPGATLPYEDYYELTIDLGDGTCERIGLANVFYYAYPEAPATPATLIQCEDSATADGLSIFNLNQANSLLTNNDTSLSVTYYSNQSDAQNDINRLDPIGYENSSPTEVLYARLANPANCNAVFPINLQVSSTPANTALLHACDTNENGIQTFDLQNSENQFFNGQASTMDIKYYYSEEAALLEDSDQELSINYTNESPYNQVIYARLENNNECFAVNEVELQVTRKPDFDFIEDVEYCLNTFPSTITLNPNYNLEPGNYSYAWGPNNETTPAIQINSAGNYSLTVTNTDTGCTRTRIINVAEKNVAVIGEIEVTDATSNNIAIINATGIGEFEYALDEIGPYQDSNVFQNLSPGFYTAYVRSKNGCGVSTKEFSVIGFDKFFTPNSDGLNDLWQVQGINSIIQPGTVIFIYNRFGKLLKQLDPKTSGWDGTFNGKPLPADDYWFHVTLEDGRVFKSHFSLIR